MELSSFSTACKPLPSEALLPQKKTWCLKNYNRLYLFPRTRVSTPMLRRTAILTGKQNHSRSQVLKCQLKEVPIVEAGSMDEVYNILAERLVPVAATESNLNFKYIVGLCGPPGAGKSTLASQVAHRVNELWVQRSSFFNELVESPEVAIVLPMDGFHLYRHELDAMKVNCILLPRGLSLKLFEKDYKLSNLSRGSVAIFINLDHILVEDPEEAHARRGSPWTFSPERLLRCLTKLRKEGSVCVPSFDHGVGDPVEDDIFVSLQHKVVIVEGNYLLLDEDMWRDFSSLLDEKWFIDVDINKAMQRVLKRHISTGKPPDVAKWRVDYNDRPNAELIMNSKKRADLIIKSVDFS